jgi:hypothetical protein
VVQCHAIQRWGHQLKMGRFWRLLLERATEPDHLSQESTNNLLQNVTRYVIPEVCTNITSSICKTRVTSVTVIPLP